MNIFQCVSLMAERCSCLLHLCAWSHSNTEPVLVLHQVLEGRASGIFSDHTKGESPPVTSTSASPPSTRVAVRALREDASQAEQAYFLHELRPYRDLTHSNVLKVLAYCLETEPFLILLQLCPKVCVSLCCCWQLKFIDRATAGVKFGIQNPFGPCWNT